MIRTGNTLRREARSLAKDTGARRCRGHRFPRTRSHRFQRTSPCPGRGRGWHISVKTTYSPAREAKSQVRPRRILKWLVASGLAIGKSSTSFSRRDYDRSQSLCIWTAIEAINITAKQVRPVHPKPVYQSQVDRQRPSVRLVQ